MFFTTIAALKSGDSTIFTEVFHRNYERVYQYTLRKTNAEYMAEEVTQLTFIKLWQYRDRLDDDIAFETQLFRIARTTMIDLLRQQNNRRIELAEQHILKSTAVNNVWENINLQELSGRLLLSMQVMPLMRRRVFEMSRFYCMSNKEIAGKLAISVKAVEFHITQALKNLRQKL